MAWGAVYCPADGSRAIAEAVRALKAKHGLAHDFEAKWTKVSPAKVHFYLALVDLFLADERLRFRGLVVPDKDLLDHSRFDQSHNDWYYKMYFTMLRPDLLRAAPLSHLSRRKGHTRWTEEQKAARGPGEQPL